MTTLPLDALVQVEAVRWVGSPTWTPVKHADYRRLAADRFIYGYQYIVHTDTTHYVVEYTKAAQLEAIAPPIPIEMNPYHVVHMLEVMSA